MSSQILTSVGVFLDGYDVSGDHNAVALQAQADAVETTTFASGGARTRLPGLKTFDANLQGLWEGGTGKINETHFNRVGASPILTLSPKNLGAEGELAMFGQLVHASYAPGAQVGDALKFAVAMQGTGDLALGTILHNATRSATGTGTIMNLGAVLSTQRIMASLHLLSITGGGSLTAKVQSAAAVGFASPTDRITFGALSAIGAQLATPVAGPITDAFWRASWTLTGSSPTALFVLAFAIQA